jgi:hypothetical protein
MRFCAIRAVKVWYEVFVLCWLLLSLSACVAVNESATSTSRAVLGRSPLLATAVVEGGCSLADALALETWLSTAQAVRKNATAWVNDAVDNPVAPLGETYERLLKAHDALATMPVQACALEMQTHLLSYLKLGLGIVQDQASGSGDLSASKTAFNALDETLAGMEESLGITLQALTTDD